MKKSHLLTLSIGGSAIVASICLGMVFAAKGNFKAIGQVDETWNHYAERMPGPQPGIKEYWVGCNSNEHLFTAPTEGTIVDKGNAWDTSGFTENDDRYTYACTHKIANSAVSNASAAPDGPAIGGGFSTLTAKDYTANESNGADVDISNYDYVTFGLNPSDYAIIFGGDSGGDDVEGVIASGKNFTMFGGAWYYFTLERNAEGKWDAYVGKWNTAKRASASLPMTAGQKASNNLNGIIQTWNWQLPEGMKLYSTEVYGTEKDHHFGAWTQTCIDTIETRTCPVCGQTEERPFNLNFQSNLYGATLFNGTTDVGGWGGGYQGGSKLNAYATDSLAYSYYGWGLLNIGLPKVNFTKFGSVVFTLQNVLVSSGDPNGNPAGFRIGFDSSNPTVFASSWDNSFVTGELRFITLGGRLYASIKLGAASVQTEITDADIINGRKSLVIYIGGYINDGCSCGLLLKSPVLDSENNTGAMTKVSTNAGNDSFTGQNLNAPFGFENAWDKTGIAAGQNFFFKNIDISSYSRLVFGVYLNSSFLYVFSGDNSKSVNIWGPRWVFFELVKSNNVWSIFYKEYNLYDGDWVANTKLTLSDTNMSSFTSVNWDGSETAIVGLTELYAI